MRGEPMWRCTSLLLSPRRLRRKVQECKIILLDLLQNLPGVEIKLCKTLSSKAERNSGSHAQVVSFRPVELRTDWGIDLPKGIVTLRRFLRCYGTKLKWLELIFKFKNHINSDFIFEKIISGKLNVITWDTNLWTEPRSLLINCVCQSWLME